MPTKHAILSGLSAEDLRAYVDHYGLEVDDRRVKTQMVDALVGCEEATIEKILGDWYRDDLKALCRALGLDDSGRAKAEIVARIIRGCSRPERGGKVPPKEPPPAAAENRPRRKDESEHRTPPDRELQLGSCRSIERDRSVNTQAHAELRAKIWEIANRLRGPYRPPQYRLVMLPMVVLRRLDCVLEPTKDAVLKRRDEMEAQQRPEAAMDRLLGKAADPKRKHPLYNTSPYTFVQLLGDAENIAPNLVSYINGFSPTARSIFERFKFADQIEKLDASNRLFTIVKAMTDVDLHPDRIDNLQMGYLFEHLVMRFNEQANEEAGDHFTPREVIRLMANLIYTDEQDVYKPGIYRTIYDPACGTGGMLSESEKLILSQNERAELALFGQEYNDESWAMCCSDMLIKDQDTANIVLGDTLGDGKTNDGFEGQRFHYLMANPPFGVEWKDQKNTVEREHKTMGFSGRFGTGLPAINDGSLLFLQHMISKMHPYEEGDEDQSGSKIAIVFNGSPLFSGDAGSGPSNIRRWIIENDWLDAIVALPDQLFYNTGIFTYVWLVTNRKPDRSGAARCSSSTAPASSRR